MLETSPAPAATASAFAMPLEEAMRTQRAIRRLKPDPVDDALVLRLIELALKAPTGSNAQNWEFVMVKDRAAKERLGTLNRGAFRIYGALGRWLARSEEHTSELQSPCNLVCRLLLEKKKKQRIKTKYKKKKNKKKK